MIVSGHSAEGVASDGPWTAPQSAAPSTRRVCAQRFNQKHGKRVLKNKSRVRSGNVRVQCVGEVGSLHYFAFWD